SGHSTDGNRKGRPRPDLPQDEAAEPVFFAVSARFRLYFRSAPAAAILTREDPVLATQIRQKDGIFYFGSVRAPELLAKVRFISRFYGEGEEIAPARVSHEDEIAQFIAKIERTDRAFQRTLSRAKVRQLKNFYERSEEHTSELQSRV